MRKKEISLKQGCIIAVVVYAVIMLIFWLCAYEQLNSRVDITDMLQNETTIGEITKDTVFTQKFVADDDGELTGITLLMATYARENNTTVVFSLYEGDVLLSERSINTSGLADNNGFTVSFEKPITLQRDNIYTLSISSPDGTIGNAVTIYAGTSYAAGKVNVTADLSPEMQTHLNGTPLGYSLCYSLITRTYLIWGRLYPLFAVGLGVVLIIYCSYMVFCDKRKKACLGLKLISAFRRYSYLIKQLVSRDFKSKYKRSVLGVLWSFLNPLLMMLVQYVVFSTLFKSSISNFALYLLVGIVCFNFFTECAGMCLGSITGNASLITKVYMPKYIYPVSRMLSSCINLAFSLIPLIGIMFITHAPFTKALVLVPIPLICLCAFSLGIGMMLATSMVFFRDTQFLWGVISTIWMYATPIIYPESILPEKYLLLFKLNPLYHIVRIMRIMIMDGVSPEPKAYLISIFMSFATLVVGAVIFKKNQDKFVLNL